MSDTVTIIVGAGAVLDFENLLHVIEYPPYINSYISWFQHLIHGCNPQEYTFVSRLAKNRLFVEVGQKEFPLIVGEYGVPVVSTNGKLMMCINGFKDAVVNH